ncbi:MAG TPA: phosphocarrier protein HPr [Clostridiaceae bacterium]|jgi:phosphocarrier protein|nr:phosphocarrier protein HPr [Clostridiaceae bacterium]HBF77723.1 phosphocarrier protein HPr [Clostridiaceae bacterium]HBG39271.1 phosphocarrier protein HPr [Clostridiaceae bacterium]HBN29596.1 phosphocarrier protein HPr [Clostridiaceae bacterium]HBX48506.1 phosphocarrier protein HPr [Clostridiaceae bacterium]
MKKSVTLLNESGLHARPAAMFVQEASKYKSNIMIEKDGKQVSAKGILGVLSLGITKGTVINIIAEGEDEAAATDALVKLVQNKFGEE